jgi:PTS system cellobiose-specific IIB component
MIRITLVCAAGVYTSLLVSKMNIAASQMNIDAIIKATAENNFGKYADHTDVLMLGPQVSYLLADAKSRYEHLGIHVTVISKEDYTSLNGEKVLKDALALAK